MAANPYVPSITDHMALPGGSSVRSSCKIVFLHAAVPAQRCLCTMASCRHAEPARDPAGILRAYATSTKSFAPALSDVQHLRWENQSDWWRGGAAKEIVGIFRSHNRGDRHDLADCFWRWERRLMVAICSQADHADERLVRSVQPLAT